MIMEIGEENGENKRVLRYTFYLNSLLLEKKERRIKFVSRFDFSILKREENRSISKQVSKEKWRIAGFIPSKSEATVSFYAAIR